jgi:hypothetical protein
MLQMMLQQRSGDKPDQLRAAQSIYFCEPLLVLTPACLLIGASDATYAQEPGGGKAWNI